jgi:hypothetical protein
MKVDMREVVDRLMLMGVECEAAAWDRPGRHWEYRGGCGVACVVGLLSVESVCCDATAETVQVVGDLDALPAGLRLLVAVAQGAALRCFPESFARYTLSVPAGGDAVLMEGRARARRPTQLVDPPILVRSAVTVRVSWAGPEHVLVVLCSAKDTKITRAIMQLECVTEGE